MWSASAEINYCSGSHSRLSTDQVAVFKSEIPKRSGTRPYTEGSRVMFSVMCAVLKTQDQGICTALSPFLFGV